MLSAPISRYSILKYLKGHPAKDGLFEHLLIPFRSIHESWRLRIDLALATL